MNLEIAATNEILAIAYEVKPFWVCLVPEKRAEFRTEGVLEVVGQSTWLTEYIGKLQAASIKVSLFIDPEEKQIAAAIECGADAIELYTGAYAEASLVADMNMQNAELKRVKQIVATV